MRRCAGTAAGCVFRTTLVPAGGGRHRLFLNTEVRRAAGVGVGDAVTVAVAPDRESREIEMPADVYRRFRRRRGALAAFRARTPTVRMAILARIIEAKRPETRRRRTEQAIEMLIRDQAS